MTASILTSNLDGISLGLNTLILLVLSPEVLGDLNPVKEVGLTIQLFLFVILFTRETRLPGLRDYKIGG